MELFAQCTTLVVLEMVNFTRLRLVKFIPISNTTLVIFIPNFTATHAITSTYFILTIYRTVHMPHAYRLYSKIIITVLRVQSFTTGSHKVIIYKITII